MPAEERNLRPYDVVVLKRSFRTWPARTTGTVVGDHDASKLVEISDYRGQQLDKFEIAEEDLELVRQELEEIDVVQLTASVGHWPAGAEGTVVIDFGEEKMLEMVGADEDPLDLPVVHRDRLKLVAKYHR